MRKREEEELKKQQEMVVYCSLCFCVILSWNCGNKLSLSMEQFASCTVGRRGLRTVQSATKDAFV